MRRKPVEVRKRYAIIISSVVTGIAVLIWLFFAYINNLGTRPVEQTREQESYTVMDLFDRSNEFLENVNQGTLYTEDEDDWTRQLRQFDDNSLYIEEAPANFESVIGDEFASTSDQI